MTDHRESKKMLSAKYDVKAHDTQYRYRRHSSTDKQNLRPRTAKSVCPFGAFFGHAILFPC
jgi:hypothetical protein